MLVTRRLSRSYAPSLLLLATALLAVASSASAQPAPGTLIAGWSGGVLAIDPATGDRVALSSSSVGSGPSLSSRPLDIIRESSGDFVVADFDSRALIRIDATTGDRTIVASTTVGSGGDFRPSRVEIEPDGSLLAYNTETNSIERVDPDTGDRTVVSSSTVGAGPNLSAVQDMLRFGMCCTSSIVGDLLVVDSNLDALIWIDTTNGNRTVVSDDSNGFGPPFETPRSIAKIVEQESVTGRIVVIDSGADAIFAVDFILGDRFVLSSSSVGTGPEFVNPHAIWPDPAGGLLASDIDLNSLLHVDLDTGNRTIRADATTGSGPGLSALWDFTAVPLENRLHWGFEGEALGGPPGYAATFPSVVGGVVQVVDVNDFDPPLAGAEGVKVVHLTTGPGDRGEPTGDDASGDGNLEFDESFLIWSVPRGLNDPGRLRFRVNYLTAEGPLPDTAEIRYYDPVLIDGPPIDLSSMNGPNGGLDAWITQDWSADAGLSLWFFGTNSGTSLFLDILDNRNPGSTSDDAERFSVSFVDDFTGWQLLEFPFTSFARKEIGNGAPNDGLGLVEVHGYSIGTLDTGGLRTFYIDDVGLFSPSGVGDRQVVDDFASGLPSGVSTNGEAIGFSTFQGDGIVAISTESTPPAPIVPATGSANDVMRLDVDVSTFGGTTRAFASSSGFVERTGFSGEPIQGPYGAVYGEGETGFISYEIDVDYPGVALLFRVRDEGDGFADTGILIDDFRWVPEPGFGLSLMAGMLGLAILGRRCREAAGDASGASGSA
jgi:hypothetical protein